MNLRDTETKGKEFEAQPLQSNAAVDDLPVVDGELIEEDLTNNKPIAEINYQTEITKSSALSAGQQKNNQNAAVRNYVLLPFIFLTVTLLGGLRIGAESSEFLFLKPALICLILATILLLLFFRANLIKPGGWFSENFPTLKNLSNAFVLFTLFTASVQIFNSLLPEKGLPFWIIVLLFLWTLWNNLFSVFDARRLLQSLGSLFGLAFVLKYLILASLSFTGEATWTQRIFEGVLKEASFGLWDLPKFSAATGYVQFFTVVFYVLGLFLLAPVSDAAGTGGASSKISSLKTS